MTGMRYTLFDTALGRCGLAWGAGGVVAVSLPERDEASTRARLLRRASEAAPAEPDGAIARAVDDIGALLAGEQRALTHIDLDMTGVPAFDRAVLGATLAIPPGETRAYGDIARAVGDDADARRVGQALGRNPFPIIVPCHRVVGADGTMTGFSAPGGTDMKRRLLKIEGALAPELFD